MMKGYCSRGNVASASIWCLLQEVRVTNRHHLRTETGNEAAQRGISKNGIAEQNRTSTRDLPSSVDANADWIPSDEGDERMSG
jgi:hypothetical protein